jgi:hypothetical protein
MNAAARELRWRTTEFSLATGNCVQAQPAQADQRPGRRMIGCDIATPSARVIGPGAFHLLCNQIPSVVLVALKTVVPFYDSTSDCLRMVLRGRHAHQGIRASRRNSTKTSSYSRIRMRRGRPPRLRRRLGSPFRRIGQCDQYDRRALPLGTKRRPLSARIAAKRSEKKPALPTWSDQNKSSTTHSIEVLS